jgi:hypothetical protein
MSSGRRAIRHGDEVEVPMARTLDEVIAGLPERERAKIEARARELVAEEMSLQREPEKSVTSR